MEPLAVGRFSVGIRPLRSCPGQATAKPERRSGTQLYESKEAGSRVSFHSPGTRGPAFSCSHLQRGNIDPAPLLPALVRGLDQLQALGAFEQRPFERRIFVQ